MTGNKKLHSSCAHVLQTMRQQETPDDGLPLNSPRRTFKWNRAPSSLLVRYKPSSLFLSEPVSAFPCRLNYGLLWRIKQTIPVNNRVVYQFNMWTIWNWKSQLCTITDTMLTAYRYKLTVMSEDGSYYTEDSIKSIVKQRRKIATWMSAAKMKTVAASHTWAVYVSVYYFTTNTANDFARQYVGLCVLTTDVRIYVFCFLCKQRYTYFSLYIQLEGIDHSLVDYYPTYV